MYKVYFVIYCFLLFCVPFSSEIIDYFPLDTGNKWVYLNKKPSVGPDTIFREVINSTIIEGNKWFILSGDILFTWGSNDTLRKDNNGDLHKYINGKDILIFKLSLLTIDTVHNIVINNYTYRTLWWSADSVLSVPAGTFTGCRTYCFELDSNICDDEHLFVFAPTVGIISEFIGSPTFTPKLLYAFIDGKVIGITGINNIRPIYINSHHSISLNKVTLNSNSSYKNTLSLPIYNLIGRHINVDRFSEGMYILKAK